MTNYIKEMMKTAGVTSHFIPRYINGGVATYWYLSEYPDFTAEKQLEIIKLILSKRMTFVIEEGKDPIKAMKDFPQTLAQLTTELMKAGELDKSKVKEILTNDN